MKTRVYIDGFNLYYGCLKGTPYKWLDILHLFEHHIIPSAHYPGRITPPYLCPDQAINYFTAKIIDSVSSATDSVSCQAKYHTAIKKHYKGRVKLIEGYYSVTQQTVKAVDAADTKKRPRDCEEVTVWKIEEKQSDVSLALHAYHDAITAQVEQVVIVTNDTDIAPAMSLIRAHTNVVVGLVVPSRAGNRRPNTDLEQHAHWTTSVITDDQLKSSQLPRVIQGRRATTKPDSWYAHPTLLQEIKEVAIPVLGGNAQFFKWMNNPNPYLDDEIPIELIESLEGGNKVLTYMKEWIAENPPS